MYASILSWRLGLCLDRPNAKISATQLIEGYNFRNPQNYLSETSSRTLLLLLIILNFETLTINREK